MSKTTNERPAGKKRYGPHFFAIVAFHVLIVLGVWQGDYGETLLNGTTL